MRGLSEEGGGFLAAGRQLERDLADPEEAASALSFRSSVALDEAEAYPEASCRWLLDWGLARWFVPVEHGGRLCGYDELCMLLRAVSRRDLSVGVALGQTLLGAMPVWVGGSPEQRQELGLRIIAGEQMALALTEEDHGSDLLAGETRGVEEPGGFRLSGQKWLINNGTRAKILSVLARTRPSGGPRGFSLFLVDRGSLGEEAVPPLPKQATLGIRGADISGFWLRDCLVPSRAVVGSPGAGLELSLKALQVTRTLCAAFSLGAADTALRSTLNFVQRRRLYGQSLLSIPHVRSVLLDAFGDLLLCECVAIIGCRALHTVPGQMSLVSSVVKALVPQKVAEVIQALAVVLGARHYLRRHHDEGIFQKMMRDHAVVPLFDGSTPVNLHGIALQLGQVLEKKSRRSDEPTSEWIEATWDLRRPLPRFDPAALDVSSHGRDASVEGLELACARVSSLTTDNASSHVLAATTRGLLQKLSDLRQKVAQAHGARARHARSNEAFAWARLYCRLHAAAAALHLWLQNRDHIEALSSDWLVLVLERLLGPGPDPGAAEPTRQRMLQTLLRLHEEKRPFSLLEIGSTQDAPKKAP